MAAMTSEGGEEEEEERYELRVLRLLFKHLLLSFTRDMHRVLTLVRRRTVTPLR